MKLLLLVLIITGVALLATALVVALYHHKKSGVGAIKLIGEIGYVDTELTPEGTVIVSGELWRATSKDHSSIDSRSRVRVVGFANNLAVVELCD
jgi:membrane-bound serine protease (ClpP class)